jgi:hypothetical protein
MIDGPTLKNHQLKPGGSADLSRAGGFVDGFFCVSLSVDCLLICHGLELTSIHDRVAIQFPHLNGGKSVCGVRDCGI